MSRLLLIGGGGHCASVADCLLSSGVFEQIGVVDITGRPVLGIPIVGTDADLPRLKEEGWTDAFITVGSVGNTAIRRRLYEKMKALGFHIPAVIDPTAVIAREVTLGEGCFIGKRAVINTGCRLGRCAIINTGAVAEHGCRVGDFVHVSPGAVLCGEVCVGDDSHIGAGAVVRQEINIGKGALVGAGSVVVKDIPDGVTACGNPCRVKES